MSDPFDELPRWQFTSEELSPGVYRVNAMRDDGVFGESTGSGPELLLADLRAWALKIDHDVAPG